MQVTQKLAVLGREGRKGVLEQAQRTTGEQAQRTAGHQAETGGPIEGRGPVLGLGVTHTQVGFTPCKGMGSQWGQVGPRRPAAL